MRLTPAQSAVADLVSQGFSNKEIAYRLGLEEPTIKAYISLASKRLGLRNRVQLAVWYVRREYEAAER